MELAELVLSLLPSLPARGAVLAFVGAGGKTSGIYALATELAARGAQILVTTTTMMYDPIREGGRALDGIELVPQFAPAADRTSPPIAASREREAARIGARAARGRTLLVASGTVPAEGKIRGIDPDVVALLAPAFDFVLVEADGSRRLPVKAPGPAEPVMPPGADLVLGFIGLDCLGTPIAADTVHRHELFAGLVGARAGEVITASTLAALAAVGDGLFKSAPGPARRLVVLNKADLLSEESREAVLDAFVRPPSGSFDLVAACSIAARSDRVLAVRNGKRV
jgi:probable selenium-dependent hydroxylase accessory protein YqeC